MPATPFLGRGRELAEAVNLLSKPEVRILTLTGPGGTGKSRLALQAAAELSEQYPQGVWWVPLAAIRDPGLVLETMAGALGAKASLAEHIGDRSMLIVLDNFEQVVEAAGDLAGLLAACPHLDLLVTSREPLHINGEHEYAVPPLLPAEGVELFVARARAVRPDFVADESVAQVCRRLDDLPLAIELGAARVKALSTRQILERLEQRLPLLTGGARDLPERQRTLRATIAWSHDLLSADEQRLFARLAVFRGGCTLEAAEAVIDADLDGLQSLVDKSLVRHTEERFWMLETIREFAAEQLEELGEVEELRRRHAQFFLELAEETEPSLVGASAGDALPRLDWDLENLRAALAWASTGRALELGLRLAASLRDYWLVRGSFTEGIRWLDLLLARDETADATHRPRALETAAALAMKSGDVAAAGQYAEEALTLAREAHDSATVARSLLILTNEARIRGQAERRDAFLGEGLGLAREMGERVLIARFLIVLGTVSLDTGELDHATRFVSEALALSEEAGDEQSIVRTSNVLGSIALHDGRVADSQALLRRALIIARRLRFMEGILNSLSMLSYAYAELGQTERAAKLHGAASHLVEVIRLLLDPHVLELQERARAQIRRSLSIERIDHLFAEGRAMSVDEAVALALEEVESDV